MLGMVVDSWRVAGVVYRCQAPRRRTLLTTSRLLTPFRGALALFVESSYNAPPERGFLWDLR